MGNKIKPNKDNYFHINMIMPSDKEYLETKQVMLGQKSIRPEFKSLSEFIDKKFRVKTLNIIYDTIDNGQRPRVQICFEFEKEVSKFLDRRTGVFDRDKQRQISDMFAETIFEIEPAKSETLVKFFRSRPTPKYLTKDVWVIFSAFEPVARIEANQNIPTHKIEQLKADLHCEELWEISRSFCGVTFFLFTDAQVKKFEKSTLKKEWTDRYFELLDQYNEFGYFKRDYFSIYLDSKENVDDNYQSNWYYYYK